MLVSNRQKKHHSGTVHLAPKKKQHTAEAWLCCTMGSQGFSLGCEEASMPTHNTRKHQPSDSIKPNVN